MTRSAIRGALWGLVLAAVFSLLMLFYWKEISPYNYPEWTQSFDLTFLLGDGSLCDNFQSLCFLFSPYARLVVTSFVYSAPIFAAIGAFVASLKTAEKLMGSRVH